MTGPLAPLFAQVEKELRYHGRLYDGEIHPEVREVLAVLLSIKQRVQAMEKALWGTRERTLADGPCWCPDWIADSWRGDDPVDEWTHHAFCLSVRAVLPASGTPDAREKEEE